MSHTHTFMAWCFRHRRYLLYISLRYVAETGVLVMLWATTSILTHYWTLNLPCLSHCCSGCHIIINLLLFDMYHGSTALFSTSSCFTVALQWGKKATKMVRLFMNFSYKLFSTVPPALRLMCNFHFFVDVTCTLLLHEHDKHNVCAMVEQLQHTMQLNSENWNYTPSYGLFHIASEGSAVFSSPRQSFKSQIKHTKFCRLPCSDTTLQEIKL